jgi:hypothetical protein
MRLKTHNGGILASGRFLRRRGTWLLLATVFWLGSIATSHAQATFDPSDEYALLIRDGNLSTDPHSTVSGNVGVLGGDTTLGYQSRVEGNLVDGHSEINLGNSTHVEGRCTTDSFGSINRGTRADCAEYTYDSNSEQFKDVGKAIANLESLEGHVTHTDSGDPRDQRRRWGAV